MIGTLKRLTYMAVGLGFLGLGALLRNMNGSPIQPWRRVLVIAGGLLFFYCGVLYYLPRGRRRRKELDELLNEAEREIRGQEKAS